MRALCARQALSCSVVQEQLSYSSTCLDVGVEWKSWIRVESKVVEWKSWIRIDSINMTSYQPVTMPAAIGDQQPYNKEASCTKALLLSREPQWRGWAPGLPLSLPQLPPLSNGGNTTALQGYEDFSVHVSNALLTWKELCKYSNFYYWISVFNSRGIAGYTMGCFYFFCMTLVFYWNHLKKDADRCDTFRPDCGVQPLLRAQGGDAHWLGRCSSPFQTLRFLCAVW